MGSASVPEKTADTEGQGKATPGAPARGDAGPLGRYRTLVQTASNQLLEEAYTEALSRMPRERLRTIRNAWLTSPPEADPSELSEDPKALAVLAVDKERRSRGFLEQALRDQPKGDTSASELVAALASSNAAARLLALEPSRREPIRASEHDISGEYGSGLEDSNSVGGAGFKDDKFDFTV